MKKVIGLLISMIALGGWFMGCLSAGTGGYKEETVNNAQPQLQQKVETQQEVESHLDKFRRLVNADAEKLIFESGDRATTESIEMALQPKVITGIAGITGEELGELGRPYYFKLRAIYKGYVRGERKAILQDMGEIKTNMMGSALEAAFGVDTAVYSVLVFGSDHVVAAFPVQANSTATFYLIAVRYTETNGQQMTQIGVLSACDIEESPFDQSRFIVASGMRFITVNDARIPSQQEVMMNMVTGGAMGNTSSNVFDPIVYPLVDLMDARVAMDRKDIRNDYTFPTVRIKYVSEILFKGQSGTTITVSTDDNVLTERLNFTGRASALRNGEKIRIYYTIAKDPLEKWEMQAIERLQ